MEIKSLDSKVKCNIRSGYCINNVSQCVNELVLNSLDANSSHIAVRVNLTTFRIQVVDDGEGITEANLHHVAKQNYTNKCHLTTDLEKVRKQFGFKGESLFSISNNSKLVKITTRPWDTNDDKTCGSTLLKTIESKPNQTPTHLIEETTERISGGTTITILEFMHNLPVRQKRTNALEFNNIKLQLQKLCIVHPHVAFSLKDDSTKKVLFNSTSVDTVENALRQQIENVDERLLKYYSVTKGRTVVKILIYLKEYENNKWQLFYVNKQPVTSPKLVCFVNDLFAKSALNSHAKRKITKGDKNFGVGNFLYLFNIACPNCKYNIVNYDEVEFKNIDAIYKIIERQVFKILEKESLLIEPEIKKKKIECQIEKRIHLSGFQGAFKAAAVRNHNPDSQEQDDDINNFVYNEDYQKEQLKLTKSRKTDQSLGHDYNKSLVNEVLTPTNTGFTVYSYPEDNYQDIEEEAEEIGKKSYRVNDDEEEMFPITTDCYRNSVTVTDPLETTSTIGRNYVLNKYLENNPGINKLKAYQRENEELRKQLAASKEKENFLKIQEEKIREKQRMVEHEKEQIRKQVEKELMVQKERQFKKHYDDYRQMMAFNSMPYDSHRVDKALGSYYRHKELKKIHSKPNFWYKQMKNQRRELPRFGHVEKPNLLWNTLDIFNNKQDSKFNDKQNDKVFNKNDQNVEDSFTLSVKLPKLTKINAFDEVPHFKTPYNRFNRHQDERFDVFNKKFHDTRLRFINSRVNNALKPECKTVFNFDDNRRHRHVFDIGLYPQPRNAKQVSDFEKTLFDLDSSFDTNFNVTKPVFPILCPETDYTKRKKCDFFRLHASENPQTRLKRSTQKQKVMRTMTTTENIRTSIVTTKNNSRNMNAGKNIKRTKKPLVSYSRTTTVITTISRSFNGVIKKKNENLKCRNKLVRNDNLGRIRGYNNRKVRLLANKGTNTSQDNENEWFDEEKSLVMKEQSIQCTISNGICNIVSNEVRKNKNLLRNKDNNQIVKKDIGIQVDFKDFIDLRRDKFKILQNVQIVPVPLLQDPNITSNECQLNDIDDISQNQQNDLLINDSVNNVDDPTLGDMIECTPDNIKSSWISRLNSLSLNIKENKANLDKQDKQNGQETIEDLQTITNLNDSNSGTKRVKGVQENDIFDRLDCFDPFNKIGNADIGKNNDDNDNFFNYDAFNESEPAKDIFRVGENKIEVTQNKLSGKLDDTHQKDNGVVFNLSSTIKDIAAEWSFNFKGIDSDKSQICKGITQDFDKSQWGLEDFIIKDNCKDKIIDIDNDNQVNQKKKGKLKKIIAPNDLFDLNSDDHQHISVGVETGIRNMGNNDIYDVDGEWLRKIDEQGGSYYVNTRTGNTVSQIPAAPELFEFTTRPVDLPKGFSQIFVDHVTPNITETISSDTKREFHAAVCESYNADLGLMHVKWKKNYLQNADYEEFFKGIYDERFIIEAQTLRLPKMRQSLSNPLNPVAFTKDMFHQLDVLRQYDRKFIVAVWKPRAVIVIFDQHAAHERVRLEELLRIYFEFNEGIFKGENRLKSTTVKPFEVVADENTIGTCEKFSDVFRKFGFDFTLIDAVNGKKCKSLMVRAVPQCLFNKHLRESVRRKEKLVESSKLLIYEIANSIYDAVCFNKWMPPMVINLINSEACRGAVMFGDELSIEECCKLIKDLSSCDLPFQCAHGRPTCAPLCELTTFSEVHEKINFKALKSRKSKASKKSKKL